MRTESKTGERQVSKNHVGIVLVIDIITITIGAVGVIGIEIVIVIAATAMILAAHTQTISIARGEDEIRSIAVDTTRKRRRVIGEIEGNAIVEAGAAVHPTKEKIATGTTVIREP